MTVLVMMAAANELTVLWRVEGSGRGKRDVWAEVQRVLQEWGVQVEEDYRRNIYHQPSDEYRADSDLRGAVQQLAVAFRIALYVANSRERPGRIESPAD